MQHHVPWAAHHLHDLPGQEASTYHEPEEVVVHAFHLASLAYLTAVLGPLLMVLGGTLPASELAGWGEIYLMTACLPLALSVLGGVLYGLPVALGERLWSVPLAWFHFALLNTALLVPFWTLLARPAAAGLSADRLLVGMVAIQLFGLACLFANLVLTAWHAREAAPPGPLMGP